MRVFLIWLDKGNDLELINLIATLEKYGHKVIYWVGDPKKEKYKPLETIFHSFRDAYHVLPAENVDTSEFLSPREDIIRRLCKVESVILTMMNRLFDGMCVDERRRVYYDMLRYWVGILEKYKPELIIFPNTPHFVFDYLIYELAHLFNIKTIAFDDTRIPGRLLYFSDFQTGSDVLRQAIHNNQGKNFLLNDLHVDLQEYYRPMTDKNYTSTPKYIEDYKKKYSTTHWLFSEPNIRKSIKNFAIFKKAPRYLFSILKQNGVAVFKKPFIHLACLLRPNLKKEYIHIQEQPDFTKQFVYLPLQHQPERTTSPQGDIFVDQVLAIEILSASLPSGWLIYVKEHPMQWTRAGIDFSSSRYRGYYKRIAKIKNVRVIPVDINSYTLIDQSQTVAAVTGSACWEAVLRSKPSLIFGYVWYQDCPGIFKVNSIATCRAALQKIVSGFSIDQQHIINYLKSFDEATIYGFISHTAARGSRLTKKESMNNIAKLLITEMQKYQSH